MVPVYPFVLLVIAIAEIPINRLAFELFFQEAPIVSLFLSFAVGLLLAFFAHQAGLWLRQATSYKTLGGKLGHLAGVVLILAIALSITLLALIGTAINLYLLRVDAGRNRVEEAQLARSILSMIAQDLRATTIYKPQDTSGVASLVAASAEFDVDSIDDKSPGGGPGSAGSVR